MPSPLQYTTPPPTAPPRSLIIFDLDHTLVASQPLASNAPVLASTLQRKPLSTFECPRTDIQRFPVQSQAFGLCMNRKKDRDQIALVHYRPYLVPLLKWCMEHCYVAFWSTGTVKYVRAIVERFLHDCQCTPSTLLFVWARAPQPPRSLNRLRIRATDTLKFVDAFTNERVVPPEGALRQTSSHKDMTYVFHRFPQLSPEHIVLVDNLPLHLADNAPENVLWCPPFTYLNACDDVLRVLLNRLKQLERVAKQGATTPAKSLKSPPKTRRRTGGRSRIRSSSSVSLSSSSSSRSSRTTPSVPVCFNANDVRKVWSHYSPTQNGLQFSNGYVSFSPTGVFANTGVYQMSVDQLNHYMQTSSLVKIPYGTQYTEGTVVQVDAKKNMAHVQVVKQRPQTVRTPKKDATGRFVSEAAVATFVSPTPTRRNSRNAINAKNAKNTDSNGDVTEVVRVPIGLVLPGGLTEGWQPRMIFA